MTDKYSKIRENFKDGDWIYGLSEHQGCSMAFDFDTDNPQPFSYLDDVDPDNFRIATAEEIKEAGYKFEQKPTNPPHKGI